MWWLAGDQFFTFENAWRFGLIVPVLISLPISYAIAEVGYRLSVAQAELQILAETDPLTGLINRRTFFAAAADVLTRTAANDQSAALLIIDADHFKQLNDSYGHATGDEALVKIAQALRANFRESDLICRVGGEEFAILIENCDEPQAAKLAERLLEDVSNRPVASDRAIVEYTVSAGIADTSHGFELQVLYKAADDAMYIAKSLGRNRVACLDRIAA